MDLMSAVFFYDSSRATPWQALFWVAMIVCIGLGIFYGIVAVAGSGDAAEAAVRGLIGCGKGLGAVIGARVLCWVLLAVCGM